LSYARHRAYAEINGQKMRLGHDYGREQESLDQWVRKIVVDVDPTAKISGYSPDVQAAIRQGRVMVGMTREQAVIAVGYPLTSETASLDSPTWRHWVSSFEEYQLLWGADGLIREISAVDTVRNAIVYQPAK
jgi:outer membrane protein assembly factor BamE (lipoprotein component of BamABCDE complex)